MKFSQILPMLALTATLVSAQNGKGQGKGQANQAAQQQAAQQQAQQQAAANGKNNGQNANANANNGQNANANANANNNNNNNNGGNALALNPANVQNNSDSTGLDAQAEAGQAASLTDAANFINFCTGKTLTNGLQVKGGSCNGIVMGDIPANTKMVSAVMINPTDGSNVGENQDINFQVQIANLQAGVFTNPDNTYYAAPQQVQGGTVVGHTHITVQDLGNSLNPTQPLDATKFAFFKGINDDGNGNGLLSAPLAGGLPAGNYRVCSMTSASNHQPVLMPVAQRGAQDDCVRFTVGGNGNNNANANANNGNNANANANNGNNANAAQASAAQASQAAQATQAAAKGQGKGQGQAAQGQNANAQAAQGQGKGQAAQGQNAQAAQGQGKGQAAQGQAAQGQGKGRRFGRPRKFAAREWIA